MSALLYFSSSQRYYQGKPQIVLQGNIGEINYTSVLVLRREAQFLFRTGSFPCEYQSHHWESSRMANPSQRHSPRVVEADRHHLDPGENFDQLLPLISK
jgi:hypothetical protein